MSLELNQVTTLFFAIALLVLGTVLTRKVGFLRKFCIPAPVVGGLLFALFATMFKSLGWLNFTLDTSLQGLFMLTFFTTIGLGASFKLVKLGWKTSRHLLARLWIFSPCSKRNWCFHGLLI